jgi:hypothetical protein
MLIAAIGACWRLVDELIQRITEVNLVFHSYQSDHGWHLLFAQHLVILGVTIALYRTFTGCNQNKSAIFLR